MNNSKQPIAIRVTKVREAAGHSQEQFAAELGVCFATVNRWENVHREPSQLALKQFDLLCQALDAKRQKSIDSTAKTLIRE